MTAQIAAYGRLVDDPQVKQTSKGTAMTLARMAVSLPCSQAQDGQATLWLSVLAFGKQADALARHEKGDLISVAGNMQISRKRLTRTVLIFTESSDQLSRATDRVP
ncbi:single-stranded DNA-binding protein, partial [Escherichia coli]|uniref:single-stranded DNA-binding protein n=1 Tax=Escherichia coli TaxID=562 RepID=UPI00201E153A